MPVTIKTFNNPIDAHLLKSKLESEGIWCALHDVNAVAYAPDPNGMIKLVIQKEDMSKALSIIDQSAHHLQDQKKSPLQCPHCNSTRNALVRLKFGNSPLIRFFIQGIKSLFGQNTRETLRCKDCNRKF